MSRPSILCNVIAVDSRRKLLRWLRTKSAHMQARQAHLRRDPSSNSTVSLTLWCLCLGLPSPPLWPPLLCMASLIWCVCSLRLLQNGVPCLDMSWMKAALCHAR